MRVYPEIGFDPAPGDTGALRAITRLATDVSGELEYLYRKLASIGTVGSGWEGKAAEAFVERVGELPTYLAAANESAQVATRALVRWLEKLADLQRQAERAERAAQDARADLSRAQQRVRVACAAVDASSAEHLPDALSALQDAERAARTARTVLDRVLELARDLLDEHRQLAGAVASELRHAANFAPPEPGFFERIGKALDSFGEFLQRIPENVAQWIKENAELIKSIADVLADVATVLGFVAIFLPPPANLIVGGIGALMGLYALAGHAVADWGGAEVSTLTYVGDVFGIVGFGLGAIGTLGKVGATAAKAGYLAKGQAGGVVLATEAFTYYARVGKIGDAIGHVGTLSGFAGTVREGDVPFEHWVPRTPGQAVLGAVSPVGLAFWNSANDGMAEDARRREEALAAEWLR